MAFTRLQYQDEVVSRMDTNTSAGRWSTADVRRALGFVFDREWRGILKTNRFYRSRKVQSITSDSSGRYALSDLSVSTGDTQKRLYRIIGVVIDNAVYQEGNLAEYLLAPTFNTGYQVWYRDGDYVQALPVQATKTLTGNDGIVVNHIPTRIDNLSGDNVSVEFPDGYEEIVILEAAAFLLAKGGTETGTSAEFRALAQSLRMDMLDDLARTSTNPTRMGYSDYAHEWGG